VKDRIARSVFWMTWSRVALQGVSFASVIIVARLLSPTDYGLMAMAGVWTGVIVMLAELGLGAGIVQFRDLDDRELNTCFWLILGLALVGYGSLYVAAPFLAGWFSAPRLSAVLRAAGLALPLVALRVVPDALLRQRIELDRVSRAEMAAGLVTIPVVVGMAWAGAGVWALVAGTLVAPLVQTVVTFFLVRWMPGVRLGGRRVREVLRFSLAILGTRISWAAYEQADVFILGKSSGDVVLGFYSMAKQLALLPVEKVSVMVNQLATPVMAELQSDHERLRAAFLRAVRLVASAAFPLCIGLMLVAHPLVEVLLTDKWASSVPLIQVLCLFALVRSVAVLLPPVLMARYRARFLFVYTTAQMVLMTLAFWIGATWGGAIGVAVALVTVYPIALAWLAREAFRSVDVSLPVIWAQIWPPILSTLTMTVVVLAIGWGIASRWTDFPLPQLLLPTATGAVTYTIVLLACGGTIRRELFEALGWVLRRRPEPTVAK